MGIFFTSSHFVGQFPPTRFPLITAIRMCHPFPVHHLGMAFLAGSKAKIQHRPTYHSLYGLTSRSTRPQLTQRTIKIGISIYQPRRSSNAASSPRNDSRLRTSLTLQHLAHVRLTVRASCIQRLD